MGQEGKIIDASFVDVLRQRNRREENEEIKSGKVPESFQENENRLEQKDVEARWAKEGGRGSLWVQGSREGGQDDQADRGLRGDGCLGA